MSDFRRLSESVLASPQIGPAEVTQAKALGVNLIINNRPDGEEHGQPTGAEIEAAATQAGIAYAAIPVSGGGFAEPQVTAMVEALERCPGTVLAYCRSGTRSTLLWSLAQAQLGKDPDEISSAAQSAGYDIAPVRPAVEMLSARARR